MSHTKDRVQDEGSRNNQGVQHQQTNKNILHSQNEDADMLDHKQSSILEQSGILDAYEYFLRQLCKNGLPSGNVYEFAAQQMLKFERKRNAEIKKRVALKNSLEALETQQMQQDQIKDNKVNKSPEKKNQQQKEQGKKVVQNETLPSNEQKQVGGQQNLKDKNQQHADKKGEEVKIENKKK